MMTSNSTHNILPNYFSIHFSGRTLHYVCNIITDNFSLEWVQESGGNDMLVMSLESIVC